MPWGLFIVESCCSIIIIVGINLRICIPLVVSDYHGSCFLVPYQVWIDWLGFVCNTKRHQQLRLISKLLGHNLFVYPEHFYASNES